MPPEKKIVESKEFRTIFVSSFGARASDNDVALLLGAEVPDLSATEMNQYEIRAMMTPKSAKVLAALLSHVVASYEKTFGTIQLTKEKEEELSSLGK